jgi:hypothetical protein
LHRRREFRGSTRRGRGGKIEKYRNFSAAPNLSAGVSAFIFLAFQSLITKFARRGPALENMPHIRARRINALGIVALGPTTPPPRSISDPIGIVR